MAIELKKNNIVCRFCLGYLLNLCLCFVWKVGTNILLDGVVYNVYW
jgi:hypothetical protein